ncbi:MAG: NADPH-dependent 2,4-dienoyl-CoA reductase [Betaproteobacteria bacterium]|nr:NADPH-dependent 2,4-dienoyl-CoA reductase [Betaproteobacteria bacterium]
MKRYPKLLSPITVGRQTLRNRVVMGSMHTRLEYGKDAVAKQAVFYAERARGGVALIITGGVSPNWEGRFEQEALTFERPDQLDEHRPIVAAVHSHRSKIILQILHAGAYAKHDDIVGISSIRSPINHRVPRPLTSGEIEATIEDFVRCAGLAIEAGYDGVEFMGSEGYFLSQCVAPRTNNRTDEWGGCVEKRIRCPVEIVRRTRARLGMGPIVSYRISATDLVEGGQTADEIDTLARAVESAGADILNVGVGWHEAVVPTIAYTVPRGAFTFATKRLKAAVKIPVVASNRINMPDVAERILADGDADLVSMARPLLADPHFVTKAAEGRTDEINTCVACNQACLDYIFSDRTASCLVNPRACRETEFPDGLTHAPRRIAVVGAGPAGMSVAMNAAARGHQVVLFEAGARIGGQINLALQIPAKVEFNEMLRYFRRQLELQRIDIRVNTPVSASDLLGEGFDCVVLATGIRPRKPDIPGIDHHSVASYIDVLSGLVEAGERVAIIGTGGIGYDVADFLTAPNHRPETTDEFLDAWGVDPLIASPGGLQAPVIHEPRRTITMLQRSSGRPGERLGKSTGWILRTELRRRGVKAIAGCSYQRIDDAGLHYSADGEDRLLAVDTIVICAGQEPNQDLAHGLRAADFDIHLIGGARLAAGLDAVRAVDEGLRLAYSL